MSRLTRNLAFCLAASVLVNVFVIGLFAGRFMRQDHPRRFGGDMDTSAPLRGVWRKHDALLRPRSEALDAARRAVREALVAEPFNLEALEAALAQLRTQSDAAQLELHRALAEAARELNVDERRRLAASRWFLRGGPHRDPGRR
jgi:uncharacterized membrane protein